MQKVKLSAFEIILLIVGIGVAILGFQLINQVFTVEKELSWLMIIAIFNWLMLLILFIALSLGVDVSKRQLDEMKNLINTINQKKSRK